MGKVQQPSPFISGINLIKNSSKSKLFHQPNDKTIRIFSLALVSLVTTVFKPAHNRRISSLKSVDNIIISKEIRVHSPLSSMMEHIQIACEIRKLTKNFL